jgi:O-antigen/teichoic acid export membrane protein
MSEKYFYVLKSLSWGLISKIIDAVTKVITVPLLITYFGKEDFGLITLAISVNAYLQLLDLGMNTGAVKYFSAWIEQKKFKLLDYVSRTTISFYGIIGVLNAIVLLIISWFGLESFGLSGNQTESMKLMLYILAFLAIINWGASVFNQLLVANHKIAVVQQVMVVRSIISLLLVYFTIEFNVNVVVYFFLFSIINSVQIIPLAYLVKKDKLIKNYKPAFNWRLFQPVLKYSLAIVAIGVFSMTATKMRPVVLSLFGDEGVGIVTEFRIMETITLFVISIGGMLIKIFLPMSSKLVLNNNSKEMSKFAQTATFYTSIICMLLCFPIIINAKEILEIYVGYEYVNLSSWLIIWLFSILAYLHNSPVSSLVLASGKTKVLIISTAISCILSLVVNAVYCDIYGVGSAIIGYSLYIFIQMTFYYAYFNVKVLQLNSKAIFVSFIIPFICAIIPMIIIQMVMINTGNIYMNMFVKLMFWFVIFSTSLLLANKLEGGNRLRINALLSGKSIM